MKHLYKYLAAGLSLALIGFIALIVVQKIQDKQKQLQTAPDNIAVTNLPNGDKKIVDNTYGFSIVSPKDWKIELPTNNQNPISLYDIDKTGDIKCKFQSSAENVVTTISELEKEASTTLNDLYTINSLRFETLKFKNFDALKTTIDAVEGGYGVSVDVLTDKTRYTFTVFPEQNNNGECVSKLNELLNNASIQ